MASKWVRTRESKFLKSNNEIDCIPIVILLISMFLLNYLTFLYATSILVSSLSSQFVVIGSNRQPFIPAPFSSSGRVCFDEFFEEKLMQMRPSPSHYADVLFINSDDFKPDFDTTCSRYV